MSLSALSKSKINLYLKVLNRRPDRYHELETLFLPLDTPADRIVLDFDEKPGIRVTSTTQDVPENLENLAGRAALAYSDMAGVAPRWTIRIEKEIPIAAGMGGGSSNAAAVLRLLNKHYGRLSGEELAALALALGADVPFFLHGLPAVATGIGEVFRYPEGRLIAPPLLVVNPHFPVSAKWAYTHLDPERIGPDGSGRLARLIDALRRNDPKGVAANLHNDLAFALYEKFPLLALLRDFMRENGALNAEITGSGPSLFAICANADERDELAGALSGAFRSITVFTN
ncbi:MAG: 4-(cytidine 5'-diphospho)-2-C-methyl-D-erythritol kinase [Lentisphaeria bacterium]|nr:4-(cytidine 5'-diphospho)-2-C-methyl-D-erythritol kinase [Lentisphaeria bacterium]